MRYTLPLIFLWGCMFFTYRANTQSDVPEKELTPAVVKKEIREGMSGAEVIQALGSPNIMTRDSRGKEVWVYDRIAAEVEIKKDVQYGTILILGFVSERKKVKTAQKTLTVIITLDGDKVESFSYHYSKF